LLARRLENVGVAYKWGGLDTPAGFDAGIKQAKPRAMFTPERAAARRVVTPPSVSIAPGLFAGVGN
jgi:hypothetical protein